LTHERRLEIFLMKSFLRDYVLQEWRGLPQSQSKGDRMLLAADVLHQLAPKLGLESRLREQEVLAAWKAIVGDFFARHSHPAKLREGTLIVNVLQPTVLFELDRKWKPVVLQKLKQRFGGRVIKEVRFRLG
jgi:predicted nucleic acid-binding Zn ribbon protein